MERTNSDVGEDDSKRFGSKDAKHDRPGMRPRDDPAAERQACIATCSRAAQPSLISTT